MTKSNFQFLNPKLLNISFDVNPSYKYDGNEPQFTNEISTKFSQMVDNSATVLLNIKISCEENEPFILRASMASKFKWNDSLESAEVERLLHENAPALLISYLRPIVSSLTTFSPLPTYDIPFINFTENKDSYTVIVSNDN